MWTCGGRTCLSLAAGRCMYARVGWGGACNNVHVNLRRKDVLLCGYCKFSGTFHSYVMPRYCKFSGTFHSCVMLRYCNCNFPLMRHATLCKFSGTFHSYVMLRYCKFSWTFHAYVMLRYCKFSWTFHSYVMLRYCKFSGTFHSCVMPHYCKFSWKNSKRCCDRHRNQNMSGWICWEFSQTPKMVFSCRRNACFWKYEPE